jgi:hypothetical protein
VIGTGTRNSLAKEFLLPRCGATFDENNVPPWTRGDFRGVFASWNQPTSARRAAVGVVRSVAEEHGTPTTPAVAVGPGIPSSTEEGTLLLRSPK